MTSVEPIKRKRVVVAPANEFTERQRLFALLRELYPVDFEVWPVTRPETCDGAIWLNASPGDLSRMSSFNWECLVCPLASINSLVPVKTGTVRFNAPDVLDPCFHHQTMVEEGIKEFSALHPVEGDELVCSLESQPYWLLRRLGSATFSIVASSPPDFLERQTVYDRFNRMRWLQLLPCFNFLKRLTREENWNPPPQRACLMFDDPNLHWPNYGFIDFAKLVRHAREFNYHASFAMVPFDARFVNRKAAALVKENSSCISLCMHGNDHTPIELAASWPLTRFTQSLAQGLRRIDRFEELSGLSVARVMVPPHGAFREEVAAPLLNLGYEAVCVSRSSFVAWNKGKSRPATFGHSVAELAQGFSLIPRQVMRRGHEGSYRLAAFLNQPIIPHGHHQDCSSGLDLLGDVAASINNIGKVQWMNMTALSRSNYLTKQKDGVLFVKMLSRRVSIPVERHVRELIVERPWMSDGTVEELLICKNGANTVFSKKCGQRSAVPSSQSGALIELISPPPAAVDYRSVRRSRYRLWPAVRRILTEARDRTEPLLAGVRGHGGL